MKEMRNHSVRIPDETMKDLRQMKQESHIPIGRLIEQAVKYLKERYDNKINGNGNIRNSN